MTLLLLLLTPNEILKKTAKMTLYGIAIWDIPKCLILETLEGLFSAGSRLVVREGIPPGP